MSADTLSVTVSDAGFDVRDHGMPLVLATTGPLSVRCHPRGTTEHTVEVRGEAGAVWKALEDHGYRVVERWESRAD